MRNRLALGTAVLFLGMFSLPQVEADRQKALADGTLSPRERAKLTREQNRASRRIYRQKHDAQTQPGTK